MLSIQIARFLVRVQVEELNQMICLQHNDWRQILFYISLPYILEFGR